MTKCLKQLVKKTKVLILGITFKENCPDIRNTGVIGIVDRLNDFGLEVSVYDPLANPLEVKKEYGFESLNTLPNKSYEAIILAVAHNEFKNLNLDKLKSSSQSIIYDVKGILENYTHKL